MKNIIVIIIVALIYTFPSLAQTKVALNNADELKAVNVKLSHETFKKVDAIKVVPTEERSEAKFVKLTGTDFKDGIIEIDISGKPAEGASGGARGFVGIAFRIDADNSAFECFYLRPTNGRSNDQLRRNHSVQYISFPEYPWHKLRKETPGKYETYADLVPGEWTKVKIVVKGDKAQLFVHGNEQPTLLVNDLKLGADQSGSIGLWVGPGTEAHFANLMVTE